MHQHVKSVYRRIVLLLAEPTSMSSSSKEIESDQTINLEKSPTLLNRLTFSVNKQPI